MRYYRDLAVSLEKRRKCRRNSADSGVMISSNDGCPQKAATSMVHDPLSTPDTSKDMISADGSSSNEMVSAEGSSGDSDHDNVFFEVEKNLSPFRVCQNTIQPAPDNETYEQNAASESQNSCTEHVVASDSSTPIVFERRNSFTVKDTSSSKTPVLHERKNSYTINDSHISETTDVILAERRNSYTIDTSVEVENLNVPVVERRNSYTLESPSPIMLQYMRSLQHQDSNQHCKLFVESVQNNVFDIGDQNEVETIEKEVLSLEDLVSDAAEYEDLKKLVFWHTCSDETSRDFKPDLQPVDSLPSSVCGSPVSVVQACSHSLENSPELVFGKPAASDPVIKRSCECICNAISNFEPLRSRDPTSPEPFDDSFCRDFRYLDLSNLSYEDADCLEGRYSECSSVSLSKFLAAGDKLPDGAEAEYVAFSYMKEQLELKHRNEFKRLLREQQREHDNLKAQFNKISSLSKHSPASKCNYAYSGSVVLKKYTPSSEHSTPVRSKSVDEQRSKGTDGFSGQNVVEVKKKPLIQNKYPPRPGLTVEQAASKINAAVRGYLTRRLFKSERVTLLVQTIKDCLATALALQGEPNIGLSELDLQSRLLQQVYMKLFKATLNLIFICAGNLLDFLIC